MKSKTVFVGEYHDGESWYRFSKQSDNKEQALQTIADFDAKKYPHRVVKVISIERVVFASGKKPK